MNRMRLDVAVEGRTRQLLMGTLPVVNVASSYGRLERVDMDLDYDDLLLIICPTPFGAPSPAALPSSDITSTVDDATFFQAPFVTCQLL